MAGIFDRFPQWRKYWKLIQESAADFGMNPNETLATHIFENGAANPGVHGPVAKGATAVGLAQIWDKTISSRTNPRGWKLMASKWNLRDGQNIEHLKTNPKFSIDYLAWRMAGTRRQFAPGAKGLDAWYASPGYNPGFTGDSRRQGDLFGPGIYLVDNPRSRFERSNGIPFPVADHDLSNVSKGGLWGDPRDGGARLHEGVDIAAPYGTPLIAVADGKIRIERGGAGGNALFINNTYYYAHLQSFNVKDGQLVKKGDVIGYVGSTGTSSSGPHLHFSIYRNGKATNPMKFLQGTEPGAGGAYSDDFNTDGFVQPSVFDMFFPGDDIGIPLPGGGGGLPGGGPGLPGQARPQIDFQRRDMSQTWQLIAQQEDVSQETLRFAGLLGEEELA